MRPEFTVRDVDEVITTRDMGALLRRSGVDPGNLEDSTFDFPLGPGSGAGTLFGVTGGVMEAAVRTVYVVVTEGETMPRLELEDVRGLEGLKEAAVCLRSPTTSRGLNRTLRLAVVSGKKKAAPGPRGICHQPPQVSFGHFYHRIIFVFLSYCTSLWTFTPNDGSLTPNDNK
jgi:iron only hydrogenase large subunit-like protein